MRTWLLTLAALPFLCVCVFLIVAVAYPQDMNVPLAGHRSMHVHADAQSIEFIASRRLLNVTDASQLPIDLDRDWGLIHVRRNTFEMGFGMAALYTMYVITVPHLLLLLLSAVLPVVALLHHRRAWLRRLNPHEIDVEPQMHTDE